MSAKDFQKCSVTMGKVWRMLSEITPQIRTNLDLGENLEGFLVIANVCRVGIIDKIESNPTWLRNDLSIRISTGVFSSK